MWGNPFEYVWVYERDAQRTMHLLLHMNMNPVFLWGIRKREKIIMSFSVTKRNLFQNVN